MGQLTAFNLEEIKTKYNVSTYVETGTGEGISLRHALKSFENLYTVEFDSDLFDLTRNALRNFHHIKFLNSSSTEALREIIPQLGKEPVLFFLDAHFPFADFRKISYEESIRTYKQLSFPLEEEITIIKELRDSSRDVIIIDDLVLYEPHTDYESVDKNQIEQLIGILESLGLGSTSGFIEKMFGETHDFHRSLRHQGYLSITPKIK